MTAHMRAFCRLAYPTLSEVNAAGPEAVVRWYRVLPSPTDEQRPIMDRIVERFRGLPDQDRVRASKAVGW